LPFLENEMRSLHIADRFIIKFPKQREKLTTSIESTDEGLPFKEGDFTFYSHPKRGQKSGYYLDLRELRFWLAQQDLKNKKVLNLFANSGSLGVIAEKKGASVINVELSNKELELAKMNYEINQLTFSTENWVTLDCWDFLKNNSLKYTNEFDLIIIDPPSLTSAKKNIPQALAAWQKLHSLALPLLKSKGMMVSANCTARINALQHRQEIEKSLLRKEKKNKNFFFLPSTFDHPILINFPEGDYLKISISTFDD
jgi:23S rRNA (cytosine1962-C5)-methyltransferase